MLTLHVKFLVLNSYGNSTRTEDGMSIPEVLMIRFYILFHWKNQDTMWSCLVTCFGGAPLFLLRGFGVRGIRQHACWNTLFFILSRTNEFSIKRICLESSTFGD